MARIGTWRKIRQVGSDLYEYENSSGISVKVFHAPTQHVGGKIMLRGRNDWAVSILRPHSLYEYLAGGNSNLHKCSKEKAFKLARAYMTLHPGKQGKRRWSH